MEERPHSIASEIDRVEQHYLVGRDQEVQTFLERLVAGPSDRRIVNLYGTGGVGKSYLLDEFRRLSEKALVKFLLLDGHSFSQNPAVFCLHLLRLLRYPEPIIQKTRTDASLLKEFCLNAIQKASEQGRIVLALDTFEEFGEMQLWLRDEFVAHLGSNILVIISGRFPLQGIWQSSPAWRQLIYSMPLADLDYEAVKQYLDRSGIKQIEKIRSIWSQTRGHPLTLSLLVSTTLAKSSRKSAFAEGQDVFSRVLETWLKEVPHHDMRELVEAAAVLRHFNQELLSFIMEKQITTEQFLKLTGYSFIRRLDRGWMLHDLLRDAIGHGLRLRRPEYYDKLWKRCILHYYLNLKQSIQKKQVAWESAEWVYYTGDQLIRTLFYQQSVSYRLEPLEPSNWAEAERYMESRLRCVKDVLIKHANLEMNERFDYVITAEESLKCWKHVSLRELYDLDRGSVKLIRDSQDEICGMSVIIPIHEQTLEYLKSKPLSSAYFSNLSESRLKELRTPSDSKAGYFVASIDVRDYADVSMRQAAGLTFISYMLSAGFVVTTSPVIPFFHAIFQSLGLEKAKNIVHFDYDDQKPTPYFVLDTRGEKLQQYLNKMIAAFGLPKEQDDEDERLLLLSMREKEVVELLIKGDSNLEIAGRLCLSEATVKKHISNVFRKLHVKNRVQLLNIFKGNQ
ncbi:helix-turn-helix transcriptional regulator [Cohnella endophytica]|nr:LuxR C-terminal-related transcriptional regulator [Cohnella endophytica]